MKVSHFSILNSLLQIAIGIYFIRKGNAVVYIGIVPVVLGLVILPIQQSLQYEVKSALVVLAVLTLLSMSIYAYAFKEMLVISAVYVEKVLMVLILANFFTFVRALYPLLRRKVSR